MVRAAVRAGAIVGGLAGVARIVSAFVPYVEGSLALEAFYALIDAGLLFGTPAVYAQTASRIGWLGMAGFSVTLVGLASIVGPDGRAFDVDLWRLGVVVISAGLALFALQIHRQCPELRCAARLWGAYVVAFLLSAAGMLGDVGQVVAGLLFGAGYVAVSIELLSSEQREAQDECV